MSTDTINRYFIFKNDFSQTKSNFSEGVDFLS